MRWKAAAWLALALTAAAAVLAAAHTHWAAWPLALIAALAVALAALAKPMTAAITQRWADSTRRGLEQDDRARELERAVGGRGRGLPSVAEITDRALLGIHPSIPLPHGADPSLATDFPLYIPRDIDADLRAWVTSHLESGGFLLLVGPATSGKTRSAYELVRTMLADWPMFAPSTARQITEYFEVNPTAGKCVIWLNETQNFLGPDGLTAEAVRSILARSRAVIVVGTIWPRNYDTLTGATTTALEAGSRDTREILSILAQRKDLGPDFSPAERERADSLAKRDPRIAEARHSASSHLAETLAAAPDLISRWVTAGDPYGAAVITAAVTARRCGHPEPLPAVVLEALAVVALTPDDRGQASTGWFAAALAWARIPVRGMAAPLVPQGNTPGLIEGDRVSDVLVQYANQNPSAPGHVITEDTWKSLIEKASPEVCRQIANEARWRRNAPIAIPEIALRKAAEAGDGGSAYDLAQLLLDQGRTVEVEQWYRKGAEAGYNPAMFNLASLMDDQGNKAEAEKWYSKSAEGGDRGAAWNLALLLNGQGRTADAEPWYVKAAEGGDHAAMRVLARLLSARGEMAEAEKWTRKAIEVEHAIEMNTIRARDERLEDLLSVTIEYLMRRPLRNIAVSM